MLPGLSTSTPYLDEDSPEGLLRRMVAGYSQPTAPPPAAPPADPSAAPVDATQASPAPAIATPGAPAPIGGSVQAPGLATPTPTTATPASPTATPSPSDLKKQGDETELARLKATGSGVSQFQHNHPILGAIARVGDVALSSLFPGVAANVPGTTVHHNVLVNRSEGQVAADTGQQEQEARTAQEEATTKQTLDTTPVIVNGVVYHVPNSQLGKIIPSQVTAQSRETVATIGAQSKMDVAHLQAQILAGKVARVLPTKDAQGNLQMEAFNQSGQSLGAVPGSLPPAAYLPHSTDATEYMQDGAGNIQALPKHATSRPVLPTGATTAAPAPPRPTGVPQTSSGPSPIGGTIAAPPAPAPAPHASSGGGGAIVARPVLDSSGKPMTGSHSADGKDVIAHTAQGPQIMSGLEAREQGYNDITILSAQMSQNLKDKRANADTSMKALTDYEDAFRELAPNLSSKDRDPLRVITSHLQDQQHSGLLGNLIDDLPVVGPLNTYANKLADGTMTSDQYNQLSPAGKKLLSLYFNAVVANFANMKNLLGSVGKNPMQLTAELNTLPLPYIDPQSAMQTFDRKKTDLTGRNANTPTVFHPQQQQQPNASAPKAPPVGTIEDGYRFKGGNPSDKNNWEVVKAK